VFSALRMYAVCNRSWLLSAVTLFLGLAPAVANIVSKEILTYTSEAFHQHNVMSDVDIIARTSVILADAMVIIATWCRTRTYRSRLARSGKVTLSDILLKDGE
ncbi:hypothetical protein WOLCODRAFT_78060, partial [Wolfiporia cocos MD-104 SS10]